MKITTVITTYNRRHCVAHSVRSALAEIPGGETIVVDDASSDDTPAFLQSTFAGEIAHGRVRVVILPKNLGVTGAKNAGYEAATGGWVVFLDSDDALIPHAGDALQAQLAEAEMYPVVFFRCRDQRGRFVGEREGEEIVLDLKTYLAKTSYGEALTAVNKTLVGAFSPYPAELRGYEGLGCARMIRRFGPGLLSAVTARTYDTRGSDRLSATRGWMKRVSLVACGHLTVAREFGSELGWRLRLEITSKGWAYKVLGLFSRMVRATK
jgi:glycosyltransferase involved in cell wall biosynthesis